MADKSETVDGVTREVINRFDEFLRKKGLKFDCVIIGGVSLILLRGGSRKTVDCDVLHPRIPDEVREASVEFAKLMRAEGHQLQDNWLNNDCDFLKVHLPKGWKSATEDLFSGDAITVHTLDRLNLLRTKLYGACEQQRHFEDCVELKPTLREIEKASLWVKGLRGHPDWAAHVDDVTRRLETRLGLERDLKADAQQERAQDRLPRLRETLLSACERPEDYDACVAMRPTKQELESVLSALKTEGHTSAWFVDHVVKRLEHQLGLDR